MKQGYHIIISFQSGEEMSFVCDDTDEVTCKWKIMAGLISNWSYGDDVLKVFFEEYNGFSYEHTFRDGNMEFTALTYLNPDLIEKMQIIEIDEQYNRYMQIKNRREKR